MSTVEREEGDRRRSDAVEKEDEVAGRAGVVENVAVRRSRWTTLRRCGRCFEWRATFLSGDERKKHEDECMRKFVGPFQSVTAHANLSIRSIGRPDVNITVRIYMDRLVPVSIIASIGLGIIS